MSSEEVASADSLLRENAELRRALDVAMRENDHHHAYEKALESKFAQISRQIGELNTTIGYQDAMLAQLRQMLAEAQADVCSLNCPSTWKTADGPPPHSAQCQAITAVLERNNQ